MRKYRRIEVSAYHRRVTVVSGRWRPEGLFANQSPHADDGVSLNDSDTCESVEPYSPEGQLIIAEAVRTLESRLTPETRAIVHSGANSLAESCLTESSSWYRSLRQFLRLKLLPSRREAA